MRRLLAPTRPDALALALLAGAALALLAAGAQHARLYHGGYAEVQVVGALFWLNAVACTAVALALVAGRAWLFVLGTLAVCGPALVSIALSHSPLGFLGFREGCCGADALVVAGAELTAIALALAGALALARGRARR